jgi:hypothetical protein
MLLHVFFFNNLITLPAMRLSVKFCSRMWGKEAFNTMKNRLNSFDLRSENCKHSFSNFIGLQYMSIKLYFGLRLFWRESYSLFNYCKKWSNYIGLNPNNTAKYSSSNFIVVMCLGFVWQALCYTLLICLPFIM